MHEDCYFFLVLLNTPENTVGFFGLADPHRTWKPARVATVDFLFLFYPHHVADTSRKRLLVYFCQHIIVGAVLYRVPYCSLDYEDASLNVRLYSSSSCSGSSLDHSFLRANHSDVLCQKKDCSCTMSWCFRATTWYVLFAKSYQGTV